MSSLYHPIPGKPLRAAIEANRTHISSQVVSTSRPHNHMPPMVITFLLNNMSNVNNSDRVIEIPVVKHGQEVEVSCYGQERGSLLKSDQSRVLLIPVSGKCTFTSHDRPI